MWSCWIFPDSNISPTHSCRAEPASRREWKATILRGDLPLSRTRSSSSFRSFTGSPCASAAWKVRLTSSTETVKLYEGRR
jgi:hypothetical protein